MPVMIPQIEPWIDEGELAELREVIESTWITEGKKTAAFEEKMRKLTGAKYALAVANGTLGLFAALKALGIGPGDEVIVPDLTFIATPNSVQLAGAVPVPVDIDRETFNIDASSIEAAITSRTKAIMPVHIYAQSADMDAVMRIARKHDLRVVEDAAQGVGVYFNGKHTGTFGEIGVLSFYGNKTITTAEGGMILTNDELLFKKCWQLKNHGREVKGTFIHPHMGYNFCFTDLQAALGLAQLKKLPEILKRKKHIYEKYAALLDGSGVKMAAVDSRGEPAHWFTNVIVENAEALQKHLEKEGVQTRRFFYPIHWQPPYKKLVKGTFPNSEWLYAHGLSLPSSVTLTDEQIEEVCGKIEKFLNHRK